ncbi:MAG: hypothetical protein R3E21_04810 [Caenibius sp.]
MRQTFKGQNCCHHGQARRDENQKTAKVRRVTYSSPGRQIWDGSVNRQRATAQNPFTGTINNRERNDDPHDAEKKKAVEQAKPIRFSRCTPQQPWQHHKARNARRVKSLSGNFQAKLLRQQASVKNQKNWDQARKTFCTFGAGDDSPNGLLLQCDGHVRH